jgi:hypothetical protein
MFGKRGGLMSALYDDSHRRLRRRFHTEGLADRIEQRLYRPTPTDDGGAGRETPVPRRKQMDWARDVLPQGDPAGAKS